MKTISLLPLALLAFWVSGCATANVNPAQARANTGYVDFYSDSADDLNWEVARFEEDSQTFRRVYSKLKVPSGGFLRLAFPPGHCRLQITFLNRAVAKPAEIELEVQDGKVTPVRVTLSDAGVAQVRTEEGSVGATAKGRYGRRTVIGSVESVLHDVSVVAEPPVAYLPKDRMSYGR